MAPELLKGRSDPRSDIDSLGATLYELLTLRAAFDEADRNVFMRRLFARRAAAAAQYRFDDPDRLGDDRGQVDVERA